MYQRVKNTHPVKYTFLGLWTNNPIMDGDQPRGHAQGRPVQRFMFLPADQVTILDTWHTLGMRGSSSHDVIVSDRFIPERHTAPLVPWSSLARHTRARSTA
jgi:hypothetical protein